MSRSTKDCFQECTITVLEVSALFLKSHREPPYFCFPTSRDVPYYFGDAVSEKNNKSSEVNDIQTGTDSNRSPAE